MRRVGALLALVAMIAGCGGGDDRITEGELPRLVLQPADLPDVWVQFDEGRLTVPDAPPGERADPTRFDRIEGWKARYRRPGSSSTSGPLVIESRADLFAGDEGAREDFDLLAQQPGALLGDGLPRRPTRRADAAALRAYPGRSIRGFARCLSRVV